MKRIICLLVMICAFLLLCSCGTSRTEPTIEEIDQALQGRWTTTKYWPIDGLPNLKVKDDITVTFKNGTVTYREMESFPDPYNRSYNDYSNGEKKDYNYVGEYRIQDEMIHCIVTLDYDKSKTKTINFKYTYKSGTLLISEDGVEFSH